MADKKQSRDNWKHVDGGYAFVIPYTCLRHENMRRVGPHGKKLLLDLGCQYSGFNNGYLCPAWELMRIEGWKSRETLLLAIAEVEHYRLLEKTRQGGRNRPNLYAFTWWQIHTKQDDPLDVLPTANPSNLWKQSRPQFQLPEGIIRRRTRKKELHVLRAA